MRTFCNWVRTGKPISYAGNYAAAPGPAPEVMAKRSHLAPSVGSSFATDERLDAQQDWFAHSCPERRRRVAAGRIAVR